MRTHNFTIVASGPALGPDDLADRLFEAGCQDATPSVQKGVIVIEFDREARNFISALFSALVDVHKAGFEVERIEPDHLVSASEIATRTGLGRAAISLYASGARGKEFPHPVVRVTTESPLWDWVQVSSWMYRQFKLPLYEVVAAKLIRDMNRAIVQDEMATSDHLAKWVVATWKKSRNLEGAS